jgi:simple sugar transport system substrate-binding protein
MRRSMKRARSRFVLAAASLVAAVLAATVFIGGAESKPSAQAGGRSAVAGSLPGGRSIAGKKILFVIYPTPLPAFTPFLNAVKAVEAMTGVDVQIAYANNDDHLMTNQIEGGIAKHVAGMALILANSSVNKPVCDAAAAGIPVVAFAINGATGSARDCVMAFLGQDFVTSGRTIGQHMIKLGLIKRGARVFCPVEDPTAAYAPSREKGVNQALAAVGAHCDLLATTDSDATTKTRMVQYLLGHRKTSAIITLGGVPLANAPAVLKQVGSQIPVGGFDVYDPRILKGIESGVICCTVDQQFYSEAFFAVMQLVLNLKYGLFPSDMATGGTGVVDKSNAAFIQTLSGKYR